jgi:P-type Mg2+ transporter
MRMRSIARPFWSIPIDELYGLLDSKPEGLGAEAARERQAAFAGYMRLPRNGSNFRLLVRQFRNPIVVILLSAALLSLFLADRTDALIIFTIIALSGLMGFWQVHSAAKVMAALFALVRIKADVWRDGTVIEVPVEGIVPGAVVELFKHAVGPPWARRLHAGYPHTADVRGVGSFEEEMHQPRRVPRP